MSAHDNLASLPPATLRAALEASEKRVRREKESIQKEIQRLQGRIHELEKGKDIPTPEMESPAVAKTNITSVSNGKRSRADSYDDDDEWVSEERWIRRPFASVRRTDPILPQRPSCSRCRTRGSRCEWDEGSTSRRCLACQRSKAGCDLKRPTLGTK